MVHFVKGKVFPPVTSDNESWIIRKAEQKKWMPLICEAGKDSWEYLGLKEQMSQYYIKPEYSLERSITKLRFILDAQCKKSHWKIS